MVGEYMYGEKLNVSLVWLLEYFNLRIAIIMLFILSVNIVFSQQVVEKEFVSTSSEALYDFFLLRSNFQGSNDMVEFSFGYYLGFMPVLNHEAREEILYASFNILFQNDIDPDIIDSIFDFRDKSGSELFAFTGFDISGRKASFPKIVIIDQVEYSENIEDYLLQDLFIGHFRFLGSKGYLGLLTSRLYNVQSSENCNFIINYDYKNLISGYLNYGNTLDTLKIASAPIRIILNLLNQGESLLADPFYIHFKYMQNRKHFGFSYYIERFKLFPFEILPSFVYNYTELEEYYTTTYFLGGFELDMADDNGVFFNCRFGSKFAPNLKFSIDYSILYDIKYSENTVNGFKFSFSMEFGSIYALVEGFYSYFDRLIKYPSSKGSGVSLILGANI